jgi:hypothetical protein
VPALHLESRRIGIFDPYTLKRRQIDELWKARRATAPKSLASVLLSAPVTEAIRKELRRGTGQRVEPAEIAKLLRETVLRPECLE